MRRIAVPLLALLAAPGFCQLSSSENVIQSAMQALSTNTTMFLRMQGTDATGKVLTGYTYDTYLSVTQDGARSYDKINITIYNGTSSTAKPVMSLIGDGVTLWRYDYLNNTYSAVNYGTYSGTQPSDYTATLFRYMSGLSEGYMSYPIMLLRQIYSVGGASYQSWMPGVSPSTDTFGNVSYSIGTPPRRYIQFVLQTGTLTAVYFDDTSTLSGLQKQSDWNIQIVPGPLISSSEFTFSPPAGARPVAGPHLPPPTGISLGGH